MAKSSVKYVCADCGYESARWFGRCPSCQGWTVEEREAEDKPKAVTAASARPVQGTGLRKLAQVSAETSDRIVTGMDELDRVLGGGITRDSVVIVAAKPGAGKSTLLMQIADVVASLGLRCLYVSGEESEGQLRRRAERILPGIRENIWVQSTGSMNEVLASVAETDPDLIILDSIQTFTLAEFPSRPGTPTQIVECTNAVIGLAKDPKRPRAVFLAGQLTKEDELAGVRTLEHMVDTVLYMEADPSEELRVLSATKNRFGSTGEMGFFTMEEDGLRPIGNPSEYFMTRRSEAQKVNGTALTAIKEGSRPMVAEVESLVSRSFTPYPTRISECMKREQLATLISILEQRGRIALYDKNVVLKTAAGLRLTQSSANLAAIVSIVSSAIARPVDPDTVFIGDVSLTGELRRVPSMESMVRELIRMKFKTVIVPKGALRRENLKKTEGVTLVEAATLAEVLRLVFGENYHQTRNTEDA